MDAFPKRLAYREYEIFLSDGRLCSLAFTLGDINEDLYLADVARSVGGHQFGMVSILSIDAPKRPLIWALSPETLHVVPSEGDAEPTGEMLRVISEQLMLFFAEIDPEVDQMDWRCRRQAPPLNASSARRSAEPDGLELMLVQR